MVRTGPLLLAAAVAPFAVRAHPVSNIVDLLKKLSDTAVEEGRTEEASYAKFKHWCSTSISEVTKAIDESKSTIDSLSSGIEGLKKSKESLASQVTDMTGEIMQMQASAVNAKKTDADRNVLYKAKRANIESTIKSVDDALKGLQTASKTDSKLLQKGLAQKSVAKALAMLASKATIQEHILLVDFVAETADPEAMGDLSKHTKQYSFKSDNVVELLKQLKTKFEDDLTTADKEETNAANSFALEQAARTNAEEAATKSKKQKAASLADTTSSLADSEDTFKNAKDDLEADSKSLKTTNSGCKSRAREWEDRSKTRKQEIEAIAMAVKILGKLTGVRTETPSNPGLPSSPVKSSSMIQVVDPKKQAIELLRSTAQTVHSKALERFAVEVSNHLNGPFDQLHSMIQKMIFRLQAEQTQEVTHKNWCDKELSNTQASKDDKTGKVEELGAKLNELDSGVAVLSIDITAADKMVADITRVMQEATEIRQTGKQENKVSLKDAEDAQAGLAKAVSVMQQFYAESGSPTQSEAVALPKSPKLWDAGYTAVADPKNADTNVVAILETVAADFAMMEAKTKAQEVAEEKEFQDQISANKIELARRRSESKQKVQTKQRKVTKSSMLKSQKKHVNSELDAVKQYSKDLKPACVDGDSSFDDRKAARDKEIKALRDAQVLLQNAFAEKKGKFLQISSHR